MPTRDYGIADLLLRRGQVEGGRLRDLAAAQGQASQQNARIYALDREASAGRASDLIRTLALVGTKAVGDYRENKQNEAANALKQQQLTQQAERDRVAEARAATQEGLALAADARAQTTFEQGQKKATDTDQQKTMLSEFLKLSFDPESKTVNRDVLNGFLMNSGMGEAAPGIFKAMDESDAANLNAKTARTKADEAEIGYAKTLVTQADASGWNPTVVDALLTQAELHGHGDQVKQMRQMSPDQLKAFGTRLLQGVPTQAQEDAHKEFETTLPSKTPNAQGLTPVQAAQDEREKQRIAVERQKALAGSVVNAPDISVARPDPLTGNKPDPRTGLTPNASYQSGMQWALDGKPLSFGLGGGGVASAARAQIYNTGSGLAAQAGVDLPTLRAEYGANRAALNRIVPIYTLTAASAGAAQDNIQLAIDQTAKVPRGNTPIVNNFKQWLQTGDKALVANPELAKLQLFIYTAAREYAKVISGSAASIAGLTDSANAAADKLLSAAQSPDTFISVAQGMQADMDNVTNNQLKQINNTSDVVARFLGTATGQGLREPAVKTDTGRGRTSGAGPVGGGAPTAADLIKKYGGG